MDCVRQRLELRAASDAAVGPRTRPGHACPLALRSLLPVSRNGPRFTRETLRADLVAASPSRSWRFRNRLPTRSCPACRRSTGCTHRGSRDSRHPVRLVAAAFDGTCRDDFAADGGQRRCALPAGTEQFYAYVTLLALLSGIFQLGFGVARAGILLSLVSHPVLMGFINAAALIIAMSQLPALLGISTRESGHLLADTWM
jgi:hypothetical protein